MQVNDLFNSLSARLEALVKGNAMVGKPISVGERHVLPLCELHLGFGGGGGQGEGQNADKPFHGLGGGAGGGVRVTPVATVIADGDQVRVQILD